MPSYFIDRKFHRCQWSLILQKKKHRHQRSREKMTGVKEYDVKNVGTNYICVQPKTKPYLSHCDDEYISSADSACFGSDQVQAFEGNNIRNDIQTLKGNRKQFVILYREFVPQTQDIFVTGCYFLLVRHVSRESDGEGIARRPLIAKINTLRSSKQKLSKIKEL